MNFERVEAILKLLNRQSHVGTLRVEGVGWKIEARRGMFGPLPFAEAPTSFQELPEPARHSIVADRVGIFRAAIPLPRRGEYVEVGRMLGSIDAVRILNPLVTQVEGYVVEVRVEDGDAVEFGQTLFVLGDEAPPADDVA